MLHVALLLFLSACASTHDEPGGGGGSGGAGSGPAGRAGAGTGSAAGSGGRASAAGRGGSAGDADRSVSGQGGAGGRSSAAGGGGESVAPAATSVTVRNAGETPVVLGNECGGRWMSLHRGDETVRWDRTCSCACSEGACGCPPVCENTQELLVPGQSARQAWDGAELRFDDPSCYEVTRPRNGEELEARACWSQTDPNLPSDCGSQSFEYAEDTAVTIDAEPAASPASLSTTIVLENRTGGPIEVLVDTCGAQGWFRLDMGPELYLSEFCPCPCTEDFERGGCPACGPCAEDRYETVANGATISFVWDGKFWFKRPACSSRYDMPSAMLVDAEVCWRTPGGSAERCGTIGFHPGQPTPVKASAF